MTNDQLTPGIGTGGEDALDVTETPAPRRRLALADRRPRGRRCSCSVAPSWIAVTGTSEKHTAVRDEAHATHAAPPATGEDQADRRPSSSAGRCHLNTVVVALVMPLATANGVGDLIKRGG